jgi:hypothetical protein
MAPHGSWRPAFTSECGPGILAGLALIIGAGFADVWMRSPPTRPTAEIEEADAKDSAWASSVLAKKRKPS